MSIDAPAQDLSTQPLPWKSKISYGVGDFGSNYSWTFVASFAMFYVTNVVGLSAAVIGTLMLVARFLDGITDILIGGMIDRTKSKMGKARPWLFWSTFPLAASQIMLFNVPAGMSQTLQYAWFFVAYLLLGAFFYTASNISYNTLVSLVTRHQGSRVQMGTIRFIFAVIAVLILTSTTTKLVDALGGGQGGWLWISVIYALIFIVFTMITVFGVKELDHRDEETDAAAKVKDSSEVGLWTRLRLLIKNKYFLMMLAAFLVVYLSQGATQGGGVYFASYVLGDPALLGVLSMAMMVPMLIGLPFVPAIAKRYSMRGANIVGAAITLVGTVIALAYSGSLPLLVIGLSFSGLGMAPLMGTMYALLAEVAEYDEITTGVRMEGTVYSAAAVGIKVGTGLGTAILGWTLALGGYDGLAATQSASAVTAITVLYLGFPVVIAVLRLVLMWFLNVEHVNKALRAPATSEAADSVTVN